MKPMPLYVIIAASLLAAMPPPIKADVTSEQVRQNLEQSRNMLLKQEDDLKRNYMETIASIDSLNKQLEQLASRKIAIETALQRNNQSLKDIEYSLRTLH